MWKSECVFGDVNIKECDYKFEIAKDGGVLCMGKGRDNVKDAA